MRVHIACAALFLVAMAFVPGATAADACSEKTYNNGVVAAETHSDCGATVSVKFYDCIWGGHWETTQVGPVAVRTYSCDPYPPA